MYGHGLLFTAADFSRKRRLFAHATKAARALVGLSYTGGSALIGLALAPIVWSRKQVMTRLLCSRLAALLVMRRLVGLGVAAGLPQVSAVRNEHWLIISIQLVLFISGGISVLALAAADYWHERDADSLFLASWVVGTFLFTAFLNWTINARSALPLIPAIGILLARRLENIRKASPRRLAASVVIALSLSGLVSLWIARADTELANTARSSAFTIYQRTHGKGGTLWFIGHWGIQYYMESLGADPLDWWNPQVNGGELVPGA